MLENLFLNDSETYCVGIYGRRETGKTTLLKNIVHCYVKNNPSDKVYLFAMHNNYEDFVVNPENIIKKHFRTHILKIVSNQKKTNNINHVLIIIDDLFGIPHKHLRALFTKMHTHNIKLFFASHLSLCVPPDIRHLIDTVFIFRDDYIANVDATHTTFFNQIIPLEQFKTNILELKDHECFSNKLQICKSSMTTFEPIVHLSNLSK